MRKEPEDEEAECEPAKAPLTPAEVWVHYVKMYLSCKLLWIITSVQ
jgi:hypothetical protein